MQSPYLLLPDRLKNVVRSSRCVAFIGSGLSIGSYDSWPELINHLCDHCRVPPRVALDKDSPPEAFLDGAQAAKLADEDAYYEFLGRHFGKAANHASLTYDAIL